MTRTRCRPGENRARYATSFARAHGRTGAYSVPTATVCVEYVASGEVISSPRWNLTASLSHDWRVGDGGKVTAAGRIHYTSRQLLYPIVVPDAYAAAETVADLDVTYRGPKNWFVQAYVKNVGNEATLLSVFPGDLSRDVTGPNAATDYRQYGFIGPPRTYGIRVGADF